MPTNTQNTKEFDAIDATCTIQIGEQDNKSIDVDKTIVSDKTDGSISGSVIGTVLDYIQHRVLKPARKHSPNTANTSLLAKAEEINVNKDIVDEKILDELSKHYDIQKTFAEGGQGILSSARDKVLNRIVALKSLKKEHLENEQVRRAFINEALITAQLEHPSIVSAYSLLKDDANGIHLTMQLVRGRTLKAILDGEISAFEQGKRSKWEYMDTLRSHLVIFLKTCEAIGYAHSRNIIHCDLKPENIMVGEYGEAYVMDWGIAKNITAEMEAVKNGKRTLDGTPRFMPPEAFCNEPRTQLSDIYELGMILYEIVCLQRGYDSKDLKTLARKIKMNERNPVKNRFGVIIPIQLAAIIDKATAPDPEDRYQSTVELANDLRNFLTDLPVAALPENFLMKSRRFLAQHIQMVLMVTLLGWAIASLVLVNNIKQARDQAILEQEQAIKDQKEAKAQAARQLRLNNILKYEQHLLEMNGNVIHASIELSNKMVEIARQLKRVVDYTEFLNEAPGQITDDQRGNLPIYDYREYENSDSMTHGKVASPTYYGKAINPDILSFVMPPNADKAAYLQHLSKLHLVSRALYNLVLYSAGMNLNAPGMEDSIKSLMLSQGLLIRRAYIGMDSTGLQIAYPFNPEYSNTYDNRKREWYIVTKQAYEKTGSKNAVWGKPYKDSGENGRLLLACTLPIVDGRDKFIGVAGADIHFEYLVNLIVKDGNDMANGVLEKFLINSNGETLCHLDREILNSLTSQNDDTLMDKILNSSVELPPQVATIIKKRDNEYDRIEVYDANNQEYVFFYSYLPNSDICIVEKCDKEAIQDKITQETHAQFDIQD